MSRSVKVGVIVTWLLRILLAVFFLMAGFTKLHGDPAMSLLFGQIGIGSWFQYFTGCVEITAGALLLIPPTGFAGGSLVVVTMMGAALVNLTVHGIVGPVPKLILSLIILAIGAFVAWRSRPGFIRQAVAKVG